MLSASSVDPARRRRAYLLVAVALPGLALALLPTRGAVSLGTHLVLFLLLVVVVSVIGGRGPALLAAVTGFALLNFLFVPPFHNLTVAEPENAVSLVVFLLVAGLVSWTVDLSARHAHRAAEAGARVEVLAAATSLRTSLLVALGHDLRTPLAVAKAGVSGALSPQFQQRGAERTELLQSADEALDRLAALMDNLLDLSRLQTGAVSPSRMPVAVADVVTGALDDLGVAPRAVLLDVPDDLPLVLADPGLLERVLANLVANAQRYAPEGIPARVVARTVGDRVEVRVADRGPGIRSEDRELVFAPFQRLGDTDAGSGIGLGLALARGLTEAMGGTVLAEETLFGGLTMVVSLATAQESP